MRGSPRSSARGRQAVFVPVFTVLIDGGLEASVNARLGAVDVVRYLSNDRVDTALASGTQGSDAEPHGRALPARAPSRRFACGEPAWVCRGIGVCGAWACGRVSVVTGACVASVVSGARSWVAGWARGVGVRPCGTPWRRREA